MVCKRCILAVQDILEKNNVKYKRIELGFAELEDEASMELQHDLDRQLRPLELEVMFDRQHVLVEKVKNEITALLNDPSMICLKLSAHLSDKLGYNYNYIANTFSDLEGITLERYFIKQRVERVKELIVYENMQLSDIIVELRYSSVSHLCQQFKKVSGITPAEFRKRCQAGRYVWRPLQEKHS